MAESEMTGWRHIDTAPKDGRLALVYRPLARESGDEPVAVKRLTGGDGHCWACTVPEGLAAGGEQGIAAGDEPLPSPPRLG